MTSNTSTGRDLTSSNERAMARLQASTPPKRNKRRTQAGRDCECGCGGTTRGGRFLPGHDAKLKGALLRQAFAEGGNGAAMAELTRRDWAHFYAAFADNETKRASAGNGPRCTICGRPIRDEESIELGMGPICEHRAWQRAQAGTGN